MGALANALRGFIPQFFRSNGQGGLTTAQDVRTYEEHVADAIEQLEAASTASKWRQGQGSPPPALGQVDDQYLDVATGDTWANLAGQGWQRIGNIAGKNGTTPVKGRDYQDGRTPVKGVDYQDGQNGQDGSQIYEGSAAPTLADAGKPRDKFYHFLTATTYAIYDYQDRVADGQNPWRQRFVTPDAPAATVVTTPGAGGSTNGVTLKSDGGGTKFLADDGTYKAVVGNTTGASLPEQTGKAGKALRTDGTAAVWQDVQEFLLFSSFAALQAYPAGQRKAGQPGRVVSDTTAANNGDYTILADGYTWQKNGTAGGFEGLTAQTSVAANRYYEYALASPRIWKAKVAQAAGNVVFPVEADATDTGGAYWVEVSRSATGGGGTGYTDAQARAQAVNLLTTANKSGINFTYANGVLNATVNAAATRLYASFSAGGRNAAQVRVLFGEQPGSYNVESSTGCSNIIYELNGAVATLPVTLQLNDSLLISATTATTDGAIILRQQ